MMRFVAILFANLYCAVDRPFRPTGQYQAEGWRAMSNQNLPCARTDGSRTLVA
jgi:hypothetical protein